MSWMHIENLPFMKNVFNYLPSSNFSFRELFWRFYVNVLRMSQNSVVNKSAERSSKGLIPITWSRPIFSDGDSAHCV